MCVLREFFLIFAQQSCTLFSHLFYKGVTWECLILWNWCSEAQFHGMKIFEVCFAAHLVLLYWSSWRYNCDQDKSLFYQFEVFNIEYDLFSLEDSFLDLKIVWYTECLFVFPRSDFVLQALASQLSNRFLWNLGVEPWRRAWLLAIQMIHSNMVSNCNVCLESLHKQWRGADFDSLLTHLCSHPFV